MYTRAYYPEEEKINVPENYDGNAFSEESVKENPTFQKEEAIPLHAPWDNPPPEKMRDEESEAVMGKPKNEGVFGTIFKRLPISNLFGGFGSLKNGLSDIGTEEILIVGVALFLLLSKGGDKECAVMLLLLLFIK
jgi:hypothetical protein